MPRFITVYLLPGAVFQSVIIAGGYGTGREVVQYFTQYGVVGGLGAIAVAMVAITVIFALSLELARTFRTYDYRTFFQVLLGRWWFLYEILVLMLFMLVIAVIGAAAGEILKTEVGLDTAAGVAIMLAAVVTLTFFGRDLVMRVLAGWSVFLYAVFTAYIVVVLTDFGGAVTSALGDASSRDGATLSGLQYTFYNVTGIPVILYAARAIETRREAIGAGIAGALIAVVPALLLHLSFAATYPDILDADLPIYRMFDLLAVPVLKVFYLIVLFGTFIETGAGNIQGFLERLDRWWTERSGDALGRGVHALVAAGGIAVAGALSSVGIVALIDRGYGTLSWGFLLLYVVPLLTVGVYRIRRENGMIQSLRSAP